MSYRTASALLRGIWLIEPGYAKAQLPLIAKLINGDTGIREAGLFPHPKSAHQHPPSLTRIKTSANTRDIFTMRPWHGTDRLSYGCIAVVDITGPILKYGDDCSYGTIDYNQLLIRLGNSDRVAGIIVNVDSPGGQADGTAMIGQTIREISKNQKPVLSIVQDGIAASAGYWIGSQAQELYVTHATSKVGSIGAYTTLLDWSGHLEQLGIKMFEIYAPQSTDKNKDYYDALAGDDSAIKADLKVLVDDFTKSVKSARGGRLNTKEENPFTGKMYYADDAKKIGLIDGIKSFAQVVQRVDQLIKLRA